MSITGRCNMICPFNHMLIDQATQDTYEYDDDGRTVFHSNKLIEKRQYGECAKEDCGVWRDGKCWYNGVER